MFTSQRFYLVKLVFLAGFSVACSQTPRQPAFTESFITEISPQDNRLFTYRALQAAHQDERREAGGQGRSGVGRQGANERTSGLPPATGKGRGGPRRMEDPAKDANLRLTQILEQTRYCPAGWFPISTTIEPGLVEIRGECKWSEDQK